MTKLTHIESRTVPEKTGQLSWLLDLAILVTAGICVIVTTVCAGLWLNRSREAAPVVLSINSGQSPDLAEAAAGPSGAPLLWKAQRAESTVYLFGSVHVLPAGTSWMDQRLFAAFDNARSVWFETRNLDLLPPVVDPKLTAGADQALFRRAVALRKEVGGFEADRSPMGRYGTGFSTDGVNVAVEAWKTGDQKSMTHHVAQLAKRDPEIYRVLIRDRHKPWIPRIETLLSEPGASFVTLGAAHMVGPDGIVAQLRRRGYDVTRVDIRTI